MSVEKKYLNIIQGEDFYYGTYMDFSINTCY